MMCAAQRSLLPPTLFPGCAASRAGLRPSTEVVL